MTLPVLRCPHRPPCPGCPELGRGLASSAAYAELARFAAEVGVALELDDAAEPLGYRVRARLAVRGRASSPKLGIFQAGSHRIADIPHCLVHHPLVNDVAAVLKQAMRELRIEPYADAPHRGLLRYLQVVIERESQRAQLVLVVNSQDRAHSAALCDRVSELLGARQHGLFVSPNTTRGNTILGPTCEWVRGPRAVRERIAGADVFFPPDAFGQSNLDLYERIVQRIAELVPDDARVAELYAGTGAIGLALLPRVRSVAFNEIGAGSLAGLRMGVDALPPPLAARTQVHAGPVAAHAGLASDADVVIADPPRKGLDPELRRALCTAPPARLIYLSCGLGSFIADTRELLGSGRFTLQRMIGYDLFPFTGHVETLACFDAARS
jgi:23S rRNA (uracil1939-C5)-methyltransferase